MHRTSVPVKDNVEILLSGLRKIKVWRYVSSSVLHYKFPVWLWEISDINVIWRENNRWATACPVYVSLFVSYQVVLEELKFEDAIHYFLECSLYLNERRTLLSNCDDININIETLLFGNDNYSYNVNSKIFGKVRTFINQSKRL